MREEIAMNRCGWLTLFIFALASLPVFGRTWTDTNGQKYEGEFVRVVRGTTVIVRLSTGQIAPIPFGRLLPEDQEVVRGILEKQGKGDLLPRRKNSQPNSAQAQPPDKQSPAEALAAGANSKPGEQRMWTDINGHKTLARLIGMDNGKVVLEFNGKSNSFPFDMFSLPDRDYVRTVMVARGEGDKVPASVPTPSVQAVPSPNTPDSTTSTTPETAKPNPMAAQSTPAASESPKPSATEPKKAGPPKPKWVRQKPPPQNPKQPQEIARVDHPPEATKPTAAASSASPTNVASAVSKSSGVSPARTTAETTSASVPVVARVCSSCKNKLPDTCKPGDYCPYCKTYLSYEDTDHGRDRAPFAFGIVGIPACIASLLYVAAVAIVRFQRHPQKK